MLIIYRTNPGFEGQIQNIAKDLRPAEMDAYLATPQGQKSSLAYIDVGELSDADLVSLTANQKAYTVDPKTKTIQKGGKPAEVVAQPSIKTRVEALEAKVASGNVIEPASIERLIS
jgi:hypothetical protein